jgi:endonuclease/exonuclease/phosphatase family metal-dependent hydrolase
VSLASLVGSDGCSSDLLRLPEAQRRDAARRVFELAQALATRDAKNRWQPAALFELAAELDAWNSDSDVTEKAVLAAVALHPPAHGVYALRFLDGWIDRGRACGAPASAVAGLECAYKAFEEGMPRTGNKDTVKTAGGALELGKIKELSPSSPVSVLRHRTNATGLVSGLPPTDAGLQLFLPLSGAASSAERERRLDDALRLSRSDTFVRLGSQNLKLHYSREDAWAHKLRRVEELAEEREWTVVCLQEVHSVDREFEKHLRTRATLYGEGRSSWAHRHLRVCDGKGGGGSGKKPEGVAFLFDLAAWAPLEARGAPAAAAYPNESGCIAACDDGGGRGCLAACDDGGGAAAAAAEAVDDNSESNGEEREKQRVQGRAGGGGSPPTTGGGRFRRAPALLCLRSTGAVGPPGVLAIVAVHLKSGGKEPTHAEARALRRVSQWAHGEAALRAGKVGLLGDAARVGVVLVGDFNLPPEHAAFGVLAAVAQPALAAGGATNTAGFLGRTGHAYDNAWLLPGSWLRIEAGASEPAPDKDLKALKAAAAALEAARRRAAGSALVSQFVEELIARSAEHEKLYSDHVAISVVVRLSGGTGGGVGGSGGGGGGGGGGVRGDAGGGAPSAPASATASYGGAVENASPTSSPESAARRLLDYAASPPTEGAQAGGGAAPDASR